MECVTMPLLMKVIVPPVAPAGASLADADAPDGPFASDSITPRKVAVWLVVTPKLPLLVNVTAELLLLGF